MKQVELFFYHTTLSADRTTIKSDWRRAIATRTKARLVCVETRFTAAQGEPQ
jgi:hypothetical protein